MSTESERFTYGRDTIPLENCDNPPMASKKTSDPLPNHQQTQDKGINNPNKTTRGIIEEFVDNTTTHGVPRFLNSSRPIHSRLFWSLVTLVLAGLLLYQGSLLVISFFKRPTTTKISIVTKSIINFPSITICNLNMMRRSTLKGTRYESLVMIDDRLNISGVGLEDDEYSWFFESSADTTKAPTTETDQRKRRQAESSSSFDNVDYEYDDWTGIQDKNNWLEFYNLSTTPDFSDLQALIKPTREELQEYGHRVEDFILQCVFDTNNCSYRNFTVIQNIRYGNCFVFNPAHKMSEERSIQTTRTGSQYGLHLTLMVEQPEYIGILSPESGVKVAINDPSIFPFPQDDGITVSTGFSTSIGLKKTTITRLGGWFGKCDKDNARDYHEPDKYAYSQRSCSRTCLQRSLRNNCSCVTDILINGSSCTPTDIEQVKCRNRVLKAYLKNELGCNCGNPCNETVYNPSVSTSLWPAERYVEHMYNRISQINPKAARFLQSQEMAKKNLVRLKIFFEELHFEKVEETPLITVEALFGGVGGLMGLYIGMSFISVIEILVFLFDLIRSLCCRLISGHSRGQRSKVIRVGP